jgi:hypothetical protein
MGTGSGERGGYVPRLILSLVLGVYGWYLAERPQHFGFLDNIDLAMHETGHLVFAPFGEFMNVLGGTLFQLLVPLAFVGYFLHKRDWHAATVPLWWAGQNLFNIGRYIADARAQELPLVGGGEHDWVWLLDEWSVLEHDLTIAGNVHAVGVWIVLGAAALGVVAAGNRDRGGG